MRARATRPPSVPVLLHACPPTTAMALSEGDLHGSLLIRDCLEADGSVLLLQLLRTALQATPPRAAVLLAARHGAAHYETALRKLGVGGGSGGAGGGTLLASLQQAGQLTVMEVLPQLSPPPPLPHANGSSTAAGGAHPPTPQQQQQQQEAGAWPSLRALHAQLLAAAEGASGSAAEGAGRPLCILVDDLSVRGAASWVLHACRGLGT